MMLSMYWRVHVSIKTKETHGQFHGYEMILRHTFWIFVPIMSASTKGNTSFYELKSNLVLHLLYFSTLLAENFFNFFFVLCIKMLT